YGVLDADHHQLRAASAGAFPFPLLRRGANGAGSELECSGRPLNLPGPRQFGTVETSLPSGSALLLASDGVLELEPKGRPRDKRRELANLLERAHSLQDLLRGLSLDEATRLEDDVALLFIQREA
ncbi:MAG TPA: SpoIIE family protein phosphatase, partial [Polyangiaceae bacterium]|nr:SpoIIE family protein phosphatase [Polyangiaceae bacterium]